LRLRLPVPSFHRVDVIYGKPDQRSWLRGAGTTIAVLAILLLLTPYEALPMRLVATGAMGTLGNEQKAAVRLHGGPLEGGDTLLQVYALVKAGDNPKRLGACFVRANAAGLKSRAQDSVVDCTIRVPGKFAAYSDLVTFDPREAAAARAQEATARGERRQAALERLDRNGANNRPDRNGRGQPNGRNAR